MEVVARILVVLALVGVVIATLIFLLWLLRELAEVLM